MRLEEILSFDNIVIQCHDNPDADALASGWAVLVFLQSCGKNAKFIYGGKFAIQKSNLVLMTKMLKIPVTHVQSLEDEPDLLVTVDCQYGERNVQQFSGKTIAVIDHHRVHGEHSTPLFEVRDNYGSCSTVVWDMLCKAGFNPAQNEDLATALYYGLFMDTSRMQELRHPKDKDMRDQLELVCSRSKLTQFQNCNLSLPEMKITGEALYSYNYSEDGRFAIVESRPCDPNILGVISDMMIEVDTVDLCVAFCMLPGGAKLSVRSCVREVMADELAAYLAEGIGSGGGHANKAGGFLKEDLLLEKITGQGEPESKLELNKEVHKLLSGRIKLYLAGHDIIDTSCAPEGLPDLSAEPVFQKLRIPIGYVYAPDLYPVGTKIVVRMLEGDLPFIIRKDTFLIIGPAGDVYKNDRDYLYSHNDLTDISFISELEYAPTVRNAVKTLASDENPKSLEDYARTAIPKSGSKIHARQLSRRTKVFVPWSDRYMLGVPGDWLAARLENPRDLYIIKKHIFEKTYEACQ